MPLKLASALVCLALLAGPTAAQIVAPYDALPADDRGRVDALYLAQRPVGTSTLSRDEIAARKGPAGWGSVFEALKVQGYYPADRSFADVERAFYRPPSAAEKAQAAQAERKAARSGRAMRGAARARKGAAPAPAGTAK
jgi:hypothetical protein